MARNPLQAQIHIGRQQLAMDDDDYRDLLERVTGQRSSARLNDDQRRAVINELKRLGFAARPPAGRYRKASEKSHVRYIFALWGELKRKGIWRNPERSSLLAFVEARTGKADPEWLTAAEAHPVIEALKAMQRQEKRDA
ncbi:hypothetical protein AN189_12995 [Loktanella sp. 3ANDIMAR09]|uniref:gp16 family protein n=1 Tax=Loktanella sp. 3ANDIMAR09 TaxID=1225657 RepID=UPI0006F6BC56|nr:regulatory protein GemA [Loktanella sp. 3ANDIMAR09]KQI67985.1 hypothetical protein AN189_12995 [Loktanella sp. 3ANDIMAR09]